MTRGYVRALDRAAETAQLARLHAAGCLDALVEREAGPAARQRLDQYLYDLAPGEELVVVSLDALGRSTGKLVLILQSLIAKGCVVRVLDPEPIRVSAEESLAGPRLLELLGRHETERSRERYGAEDAPGRGGRKRALTVEQAAEAARRYEAGESLASIAERLEVRRGAVVQALSGRRRLGETLYRATGGAPRRVRTSLHRLGDQPDPAAAPTEDASVQDNVRHDDVASQDYAYTRQLWRR